MRVPLPTNKRSAVVAGVAMVTMVASFSASMTGAVRPVRARGGRFYRPPSRVSWQAPSTLLRAPHETTMAEVMAMLEPGQFANVAGRDDGLESDSAPGVREAVLG